MIPVNTPLFVGKEKKYLQQCIESGWVSSEGPFVKKFELNMAKYIGRKYTTACSSGTAAIEIAIRALELKKGDEVIMPTFTIISCAQSLISHGIKPVFVDCDYKSFNMNVDDVSLKINSKTRAIMVVHIFGLTVDLDPILKLAKKKKLYVIEDAAEMHGQEYKGKKCGSFGDISTFSFYSNKHITTGEGGMVLTNNKKLDNKCKSLRNLCFTKNRFVHNNLGFNYRMTNLQAAVGVAQLEKINFIIKKKRWIGYIYNKFLKDLKTINLPIIKTSYCENIYWVYAITLKDNCRKTAKQIIRELSYYKIGARPFFYPMHKQPVFNKMNLFLNDKHPNSEKLYKKGFYVPSGLALSKNQIAKVSKVLCKILK
jgi:perosamine synthetase